MPVLESVLTTAYEVLSFKAADEECLPFKLIYTLCHEAAMRLWISPESCHCCWNDVRNSLRRSNFQHVLLLSATMINTQHGPYKNAKNKQRILESAEYYALNSSPDDFANLQDCMCADNGVEDVEDCDLIPKDPSDIQSLKCVTTLPPFVT